MRPAGRAHCAWGDRGAFGKTFVACDSYGWSSRWSAQNLFATIGKPRDAITCTKYRRHGVRAPFGLLGEAGALYFLAEVFPLHLDDDTHLLEAGAHSFADAVA
jgi:hypothetical protein